MHADAHGRIRVHAQSDTWAPTNARKHLQTCLSVYISKTLHTQRHTCTVSHACAQSHTHARTRFALNVCLRLCHHKWLRRLLGVTCGMRRYVHVRQQQLHDAVHGSQRQGTARPAASTASGAGKATWSSLKGPCPSRAEFCLQSLHVRMQIQQVPSMQSCKLLVNETGSIRTLQIGMPSICHTSRACRLPQQPALSQKHYRARAKGERDNFL